MSRLKVHTIDQSESDTTAFVLSCNRLHLLDRTIKSFLETRDYVTKIVIVDDSAKEGVFETLVEKYGTIADVVCFPENRGLWWAKDFMATFCNTPYIFYVEDDWLFLKPGYLSKSKKILETYRDIGSIDISWRTFEEEGLDTRETTLVDDMFFYKKPWRITANHLHWCIWQGSPNLKRREDLILLGRVEKYYTEWNIDRKFYALGFKGVYLNDRYVVHTGDGDSVMVNKRPNEAATPESLFPQELRKTRFFPEFDYYGVDNKLFTERGTSEVSYVSRDRVLVTCFRDINRSAVDGRSFSDHYIKGIEKIAEINEPLVVFCDVAFHNHILTIRGSKPTLVLPIHKDALLGMRNFNRIKEICEKPEWFNQSPWMAKSIIRNPEYLALTHNKMELLAFSAKCNFFRGKKFYWIDSGISSSYYIENSLNDYDFTKIYPNNFFITSYPYNIEIAREIHGYSIDGYLKMCGKLPDRVYRACIFGGDKETIERANIAFNAVLDESVAQGFIGTEEALFTVMALRDDALFSEYAMPNGDIKNYLNTIRK
jgi:glycosyltransferase involved in cell wall biosynthesis